MVIVGPEDPLVKGVYDDFKNDPRTHNIPVIGPSKAGAVLEAQQGLRQAVYEAPQHPDSPIRNASTAST